MREIKFRAWFDGEMHSHEDLVNMDQETHAMYTIITHEVKNGEVYMQYTGLKDKSGKAIYEGDVVLYEHSQGWCPNIKGKVVFLEGCWKIDNGEELYNLWSESDELTILGNIYENSELLEEVRRGKGES